MRATEETTRHERRRDIEIESNNVQERERDSISENGGEKEYRRGPRREREREQ